MNKRLVAVLVLVAFLWGVFAIATYFWLIPIQQNYDFHPRWVGAREMLRGRNPYRFRITDAMLDAENLPYFHARTFDYPATITYVLLPFWLLPHEIAASLWCGLQLVIFSTLPVLMYTNLHWKPSPFRLAAIILLTMIGFQNALTVYTLGQFTGFGLACLVLAWWGISRGYHTFAALILVGTTIRPDSMVFGTAILGWVLLKRDFRFAAIVLTVMGGLFLLSLLQIGWWMPDFIERLREYQRIGESNWPPDLIGNTALAVVFVLAMVLWAGWLLRETWSLPDRHQLLWFLATIITVALLVLPQTADYTLVYPGAGLVIVVDRARQCDDPAAFRMVARSGLCGHVRV